MLVKPPIDRLNCRFQYVPVINDWPHFESIWSQTVWKSTACIGSFPNPYTYIYTYIWCIVTWLTIHGEDAVMDVENGCPLFNFGNFTCKLYTKCEQSYKTRCGLMSISIKTKQIHQKLRSYRFSNGVACQSYEPFYGITVNMHSYNLQTKYMLKKLSPKVEEIQHRYVSPTHTYFSIVRGQL